VARKSKNTVDGYKFHRCEIGIAKDCGAGGILILGEKNPGAHFSFDEIYFVRKRREYAK